MHPQAAEVAQSARDLGLVIDIVEFDQTTRTAEEAAAAIGCQVGQIVKSLLFVVNGQPVMALVSGQNRLDERKLATIRGVGRKKVRRADAETVKKVTGYTIGGVPPLGHKEFLPIYIDLDLMEYTVIWAAAGTPHAVFAISPVELATISGAIASDIKA